MAQPPDISDTFVREVDENLRRDQLRDLAKKYAGWMIAAVILFLAASGGCIYWQDYQRQAVRESRSSSSPRCSPTSATGKIASRARAARYLANSGSKAVRASALFARAAVAIQQNDTKLATANYREIAGDNEPAQALRDLALIRQTALEFDAEARRGHRPHSSRWPSPAIRGSEAPAR